MGSVVDSGRWWNETNCFLLWEEVFYFFICPVLKRCFHFVCLTCPIMALLTHISGSWNSSLFEINPQRDVKNPWALRVCARHFLSWVVRPWIRGRDKAIGVFASSIHDKRDFVAMGESFHMSFITDGTNLSCDSHGVEGRIICETHWDPAPLLCALGKRVCLLTEGTFYWNQPVQLFFNLSFLILLVNQTIEVAQAFIGLFI